MIFKKHPDLEGQHALLSPSKHYWLNYDEYKLYQFYTRIRASEEGTKLHEFAKTCILLNQKLPKSQKTLNMYVNDAIGYRMTPEQVLYYSNNCFGTADAISYRRHELRIHDLKTGKVTPGHMEQLLIYAGIFCLEYNVNPANIKTFLRIYQNDDIVEYLPEPEELNEVISRIKDADKIIKDLQGQEG